MSASLTDKVTDTRNGARPASTTATGTRSAGGNSLACGSLTGWPTASKVHFVTYRIDTQSNPVAGTQLDCAGIVSGNTIGSFTVLDGTDTGNSIGDIVEMLPTASWGQDVSDAFLVAHDRTGALKSGATFTSPTLITPALGTPTSGVMTNVTGTATNLTVGLATDTVTKTGSGSTYVTNSSPTIASPTFTSPVLGTPVSGVATNLTGTASGLTAGAVTTNANLTGDVTSSGNATTISTSAIKLGYTSITSDFTTASTSDVQVTSLTSTVTVPAGGRGVKITVQSYGTGSSTAGAAAAATIWDGTVGSGTLLNEFNNFSGGAGDVNGCHLVAFVTPAAGSKTYNVGLRASAGTAAFKASANRPGFILVECI